MAVLIERINRFCDCMTKSKHSLVPEGENLRRAVRWLSEHAPPTAAVINQAACRFDLTPLEEDFLLQHFRSKRGWEHFHHLADTGVRGTGATIETAFEQAALALTAIVTEPGSVRVRKTVKIECIEQDRELLLVDWLNAVIYAMVTGNMLFAAFNVKIAGDRLTATLGGEEIDRDRHELAVEPKGATLTELKVIRHDDGAWLAQCVIDV